MFSMIDIQATKQRFGIIGNSPALNHAVQVAAQVAPTDMTVLITGESGSGKESFSKIIHSLSARKHNNFIAINCGAIPEGTIDSELFGHEKGSFTGATEARKGYFEVTDGGTIFLDEIGEMPLGTQARLLRVLENGDFIRVGSSKVQKTNVRVVAATNVDLVKAVEKGKFRQDLYYRLNTVPIYIPPLRERGNDIELLFRKFATDFAEKYHVKPVALNDEAKVLLLRYRFPGNIRQLKNIAEQVSVLELARDIGSETLAKYLPQAQQSYLPALLPNQADGKEDFSERDLLYKVLFDMRREMTELKKIVLDNLRTQTGGNAVIQEHRGLFDLDEEAASLPTGFRNRAIESYDDYASVLDVTHAEVEDEGSLSLEKKEKEMIMKALRKNNHKRKYAAQDLGISERTLYRKIKQYEIDEE
ncbi:MAG: sigma-54 dependent transcriptional regulator [Bernardetiaceae bacterium]|nr:sigma-54 dependent transcriptional regulator [Bernardetiaceae bacterium]